MRLHSNRVRPEPWGCGGLVPLDTPAEQPLPLNSAGFDHKIVRENGFARNRQPAATPGEGMKECPPRRALSSLRWLRVLPDTRTEWHPSRVRSSLLGVYLLFSLSSLRERLSSSLRLPPLPLHGYPLRITPPLFRSFDSPSRYSCTHRTEKL